MLQTRWVYTWYQTVVLNPRPESLKLVLGHFTDVRAFEFTTQSLMFGRHAQIINIGEGLTHVINPDNLSTLLYVPEYRFSF